MDFAFDDDATSFRQELARWASTVLAPHYQSDDRAGTFRRELAVDMARMGLTGLRVPGEYGGQGASAVVHRRPPLTVGPLLVRLVSGACHRAPAHRACATRRTTVSGDSTDRET
jgi:alkylation response protein AidB-like acyl-CoA dehydrogenase